MKLSSSICLSLLIGLVQACGGTHSDAGPSDGSSVSGAGTLGTQAGGGGAQQSASAGGSDGGGSAPLPQVSSEKLDVLFVVDNSVSMSGKQQVLAKSLPKFVSRLVNPLCVDDQGKPTAAQPAGPSAACASGKREFEPLADIHFGAITTSIGSHGGDVCLNQNLLLEQDDQGQLLPSKRSGVASYQDSGYLAFDATGSAGENDPNHLTEGLSALIIAAGEQGCGYEAPLEAMYRFLVDPEPPVSVQVVDQLSTPMGINDVLLAQRRAFLRPDSSLAIVIFSDENDCSIMDSGLGWYVASMSGGVGGNPALRMPRATSACDVNPNDVCCRSCAKRENAPPPGCAELATDSVCSAAPTSQAVVNYDPLDDSLNLRCFDQQRRFGLDFLHPIERYSKALSDPKIENRAGVLVDNPLFAARDGMGPRSPSLVSVSVIVGVPWQDLATTASLNGGTLEYLDAAGLEKNERWPLVVGDPKHNVAPGDPFMIESVAPRMGQNPLTGVPIAPATSTNPQENPINGHEASNVDKADIQPACIFALPAPVECLPGALGCDCSPDRDGNLSNLIAQNSPLCQPPTGGPPSSTQYYGRAYPGTRELSFARQMGGRAVAASLCPKTLSDATSPEYGYGPVFNTLLGRIAKTVK